MNICSYQPTKYLDDKGINDRLRFLFKNVCGLTTRALGTINLFDATVSFSVNADPNIGGTIFSPNTPALDSVVYVSTIDASLWTYNGVSYVAYVPPYWSKLGNIGTTPGTHFVGTVDGVGLMFKVNNTQAGYLDLATENVSFGMESLKANISGSSCAAFGKMSLLKNTSGTQNTAIGAYSLVENLNGDSNVGLGLSSLQFNTSGNGNLGLGYCAGRYNTTASNQIFINNIARNNYVGDQTESPIYIQQDAIVANQKIYLNALMNLSYVPTYATNAAAILGGLVAGNLYKVNNAGNYTLGIVV